MPVFRKIPRFKVGRGKKDLLDSGAGVTREEPVEVVNNQTLSEELESTRRRLERETRKVARLREKLVEQRIAARAPASENGRPQVFFLVGLGKSGTGWLMQMLNSHPEVLCKGEGQFFGADLNDKAVERINRGKPLNRNRPTGSLYNAITGSEAIRLWVEHATWTKNADPDVHLNGLAGVAIEHFLITRLPKTGKWIVGDKSPLQSSDVIRQVSVSIPRAKVIHIVRDGRDQAVSWMHHLWNRATVREGSFGLTPEEVAKRDDFYKNRQVPLKVDGGGIFTEDRLRTVAGYWAERVGQTVEDGPTVLGDRYTQVKYEDLLEKPEEEMRRLFGFLGADTSEEAVHRCVESADFEALSGRKRGSEDYELGWRKQRKGVAGDWRNIFTEQDKAIYKEVAGDLLINLGYAKDNTW